MGRITEVYPGNDGGVRVVDVLAQGKVLRRPITKLVSILDSELEIPSSGGVCLGQLDEDAERLSATGSRDAAE